MGWERVTCQAGRPVSVRSVGTVGFRDQLVVRVKFRDWPTFRVTGTDMELGLIG